MKTKQSYKLTQSLFTGVISLNGNYRFRMTGPVHGSAGTPDHWHEGELRNVERARGYWAHVKAVLDSVDCEAQ